MEYRNQMPKVVPLAFIEFGSPKFPQKGLKVRFFGRKPATQQMNLLDDTQKVRILCPG